MIVILLDSNSNYKSASANELIRKTHHCHVVVIIFRPWRLNTGSFFKKRRTEDIFWSNPYVLMTHKHRGGISGSRNDINVESHKVRHNKSSVTYKTGTKWEPVIGFLLVHLATLDAHYCPVVSCNAPPCFTQLLPKPVRRREKLLVPFVPLLTKKCCSVLIQWPHCSIQAAANVVYKLAVASWLHHN